MTTPAEPEMRLTECHCFTDEDYPYCNDRAMPCKYKDQFSRRKCPDYKSVIHQQVECDVRQGTTFAQRMVSDALGESIYNRQHPYPQEPQCNWVLKNLLRVYKEDRETDKDLFPSIYYDGKITAINQAIMEIEATSAITPEQCPHWECIEHSDGMEWCCNKKAKIPNGKDIKAIENYIYSSMNHTPEWEKAEQAYQNILSSRTQDTPAQQRIADAIKELEKCPGDSYVNPKVVISWLKRGTKFCGCMEIIEGKPICTSNDPCDEQIHDGYDEPVKCRESITLLQEKRP